MVPSWPKAEVSREVTPDSQMVRYEGRSGPIPIVDISLQTVGNRPTADVEVDVAEVYLLFIHRSPFREQPL